jgi:hypothetical protein
MNRISSRRKAATFPLTIGTPYGLVKLELTHCAHCGQHFNFRILESAPLLSTLAAEPFLYRLMGSLEAIGSELWASLPPEPVRAEIDANTYEPPRLKIPQS